MSEVLVLNESEPNASFAANLGSPKATCEHANGVAYSPPTAIASLCPQHTPCVDLFGEADERSGRLDAEHTTVENISSWFAGSSRRWRNGPAAPAWIFALVFSMNMKTKVTFRGATSVAQSSDLP